MIQKISNRLLVLFMMISTSLFESCGDTQRIAPNLYERRDYLLKEFLNKSIIRSRGKNIVMLSYYQNEKVNQFFFEKVENDFVLTNDILQYPINQISSLALVEKADSFNYKKSMGAEVKSLLQKMDALQIKDVSAEFGSLGIDMKIYFGDNDVLLYVSNPAEIKNERWKQYINTAKKKFNRNWYYTRDE